MRKKSPFLFLLYFCLFSVLSLYAEKWPDWIGMGTFTSRELKNFPEDLRIWKGYVEEDGMFFTGEGRSEVSAILSTVEQFADLSLQMQQSFVTESSFYSSDGSESVTFACSIITDPSDFIQVVDRYADGKYYYVLAFISSRDMQKILVENFHNADSDVIKQLEVSNSGNEKELCSELKFTKRYKREGR
ncbi:MAG: hypothetical protein J6I53_10035 [Treponema sp.]|nr:hypothetical protein [Treponema sp.]